MLYMNDINRWVTVQARGRVAELLDELRQTVGAQGGGATRRMSTVYLYPIEKYKKKSKVTLYIEIYLDIYIDRWIDWIRTG